MNSHATPGIFVAAVVGAAIGLSFSWWVFPDDALVIYVSGVIAGAWYLPRSLRRIGYFQPDQPDSY